MTAETYTARHEAKRSTFSHLRELGASVTNGRKGPVVAASSGLALTMVATAAGAVTAPTPEVNAQAEIAATSISEEAQAALAAPTSVDVAADSEWVSGAAVKVEAEKAPAPVVRPAVQAQPAQRTERQAPATRSAARKAPAEAELPPVEASGFGAQVVAIAMRYIGTPYVHGGSTPAGFDCSGFTQYVYAQVGVNLPRSSGAQRGAGRVVPASEARPGDLIWWPGHVGIYLGNGQHIAARNPGTPLKAGPIYRGGATFIRLGG